MRIAIVGAPDSVEKIYRILSSKYENIDFILKKEEKIDNMLKILEEMKDEVDGVYQTLLLLLIRYPHLRHLSLTLYFYLCFLSHFSSSKSSL